LENLIEIISGSLRRSATQGATVVRIDIGAG
jgi:hypothetical protein